MLLQLHSNFTFINGGKIRAYVNEEGILKVDSRFVNWEDTMYALTYDIKGFSLPNEWISYWKPENIKLRSYYTKFYVKSKKLDNNIAFICKYNHFQRPIIIDRNGWLIDGYTWLNAANITASFKKVPVVKLENVELIYLR